MIYIYSYVVNNPYFIYLQYLSLKKFMKNEYTFIIYNDAKDWEDYSNFNNPSLKQQIKDICLKLGIECIDIPNKHHRLINIGGTERTSDSCNYILKEQIRKNGKSLVIDSDMFLIDYLDIEEKYKDCHIAVVLQNREYIVYFWSGIYYFNMPEIKNKDLLNWQEYKNITDVGGKMYEYIINDKKNETKYYRIEHLLSLKWSKKDLPDNIDKRILEFLENDDRNVNGKYYAEIYDNCFIHYRAGGNWNKEKYTKVKKRLELFSEIFLKICDE